jgi:hypothetical protein
VQSALPIASSFAFVSFPPSFAARQRDAAVAFQIVAIRPLAVRLVPASTIRPRRANSIRLGLTVLAFISSSFVISSSVLGVRQINS